MKRMRLIYAMLLAVIYVTATSLSSISLLTCHHDHHHHNHHHANTCDKECCHNHVAISDICCDHDHPILGEHHTDYIAKTERSGLSSSQVLTIMLSPALLGEPLSYKAWSDQPIISPHPGDEAVPLLAAIHQSEALRAPPTLV